MASINDLPDTLEALRAVTITGTATDNDGNLTTDGRAPRSRSPSTAAPPGRSRAPPTTGPPGAFYWYPTTQGTVTIKARAIDDSLNVYNITPDSEAVIVTADHLQRLQR